ncbi:synaptotagmin-2-like [Arachis ipaensis]|uniref:synaptotagmin-2-like n=1 Tax=Arachis ipaensis TaxID=130454 RepID=UPI0007AEFB9C|nr:synaptotagmin-2-like [Arachis ipaensis]
MSFFSTIFGFFGFGIGISFGLVAGYFLFIYSESADVKDPEIQPLANQDSETLQRIIPEIPLWIKNPDFDRVDWLNRLIEYMWPYLNKVSTVCLKYVWLLYYYFQELIKDQVANMYLWPKTLDVQIMDPAKAMRRAIGILVVKVVRAMKLKKKDLLGASDPYVKIKLSGDNMPAKKTTVKHKNLNPEWNEEFNLLVKDPETQTLEFEVYDWEQVGRHDFMGMNVVALKELKEEETKVITLDLLKNMDPNDGANDKSRGQIVMELTYKAFKEEEMGKGFEETEMMMMDKAPEGTPPGGGLLVVVVHEAQDVEGKYHTNPQVRLIFRGEERKTKHVKKNRDPRWEEEFQFVVEEPPTNDKLHVEVVSTSSRNLLRQKESLGYADISLADVVTNKRINERYHLIDSKNGRLQIELMWRPSQPAT